VETADRDEHGIAGPWRARGDVEPRLGVGERRGGGPSSEQRETCGRESGSHRASIPRAGWHAGRRVTYSLIVRVSVFLTRTWQSNADRAVVWVADSQTLVR